MARFFIDRPVFAWVISLLIMLLGALAITVLSFMMLGDALRDALDPVSRAWRA